MQGYRDQNFGTWITRVTGDPGTSIPNIGGNWGSMERHRYSKVPIWNADGSIMALTKRNGAGSDLFLDGETFEVLFEKSIPGEGRWHPTNPDLYISVWSNAIGTWNVHTGATDKKNI